MQTFKRYSVSFKNYCLFQLKITLGNISSLNLIFFTARKNCPVETMLRRTRRISDQIGRQAIFFFKKSGHQEFLWLLNQFRATLINIKLRYVNVHQHATEPQQLLKST